MLKRLSYPLSWVGGDSASSDGKPEGDSAPTTSDSTQSVFSKVFSRYVGNHPLFLDFLHTLLIYNT